MTTQTLKNLIQEIVSQAYQLKETIIDEASPVNYACIFAQSEEKYAMLIEATKEISIIIAIETTMGPVFKIHPLETIAGKLQLLKIRKPDPQRPEQGDADFTLQDYLRFKKEHLGKAWYTLIERENFEMIEYQDPDSDVLVYFSHPPLDVQLGIV